MLSSTPSTAFVASARDRPAAPATDSTDQTEQPTTPEPPEPAPIKATAITPCGLSTAQLAVILPTVVREAFPIVAPVVVADWK